MRSGGVCISGGVLYRWVVPLPPSVAPERLALYRRIERVVWAAVALCVALSATGHVLTDFLVGASGWNGPPSIGLRVVLHVCAAALPSTIGAVVALRFAFARALELANQIDVRSAAEARAARLDGALLVARTSAHHVNNALAPVVGYAELLATSPVVAAEPLLRSYAGEILVSANEAAAALHALQRIVRLEEDRSAPVPMLDLRSSMEAAGVSTY